MHLLLLSELVSALRANDSDAFRRWLSGGIQDLGRPAVEELMLEWMNPQLTVEEMDRLVGWHLRVSWRQPAWRVVLFCAGVGGLTLA